jgi:hypothetical protein
VLPLQSAYPKGKRHNLLPPASFLLLYKLKDSVENPIFFQTASMSQLEKRWNGDFFIWCDFFERKSKMALDGNEAAKICRTV